MPKDRQKVRAGRLGGLTTKARYGGKAMTANATAGLLAKFEREVDPDGVLAEAERIDRAKAARRAFLIRIRENGR